MLRVYNATARYVDQGGNKRPGAFAIYLEPWHSDIFDFLDLKKNTGKEEQVNTLNMIENSRYNPMHKYKKTLPFYVHGHKFVLGLIQTNFSMCQ